MTAMIQTTNFAKLREITEKTFTIKDTQHTTRTQDLDQWTQKPNERYCYYS